MGSSNITKKRLGRIFLIEQRAGPTNTPKYQSMATAGAISWPQGDVAQIEVPSDVDRNAWEVVDETQASIERPTITLTFRDKMGASDILRLVRQRCPIDIQIHVGLCTDPRDFDGGWSSGKVRVLESAYPTEYGTSDLMAMESGDDAAVDQTIPFSARDMYEIAPMSYAERAAGQVGQEIVAIVVCDTPGCGNCATPSDGCQKVFAVSAPAGSSPGVLPEVIYSDDGFTTSGDTPITTLSIGEDPNDAACVGNNLVVVSQTSGSLHWANKEDILDGTETWAEVTAGFAATKGPRAIVSYSPRDTWIVGAGGYIYFTEDPTNGVEVQEAGGLTTEDLNDVDAYSTSLVVAVGDNNTVLYTTTGGDTWLQVTGPAAGVDLLCVAIRKENEWWVGAADGNLYYTVDAGAHWAQKAFPGDGTGQVTDIVWASETVGFLAHKTAAPRGRILRTISGGFSWFVVPEGAGSLPAADGFNSLAVCGREVNILYAGGLADDGKDGIIIKGAANYE